MQNKRFWSNVIHESWYELMPGLWDSEYMRELLQFVMKNQPIYPETKNLFKPFKMTPFDELRVVIIGKEPCTEGKSNGLAFGANDDALTLTTAQQNIRTNVECSTGKLKIDFDITLESWARQGVLLLNESLSVYPKTPGSHRLRWQKFVAAVLTMITCHKDCVHYCLWGIEAGKWDKFIVEHPVWYAPSPDETKWEINHFLEINKQLKEPIVW